MSRAIGVSSSVSMDVDAVWRTVDDQRAGVADLLDDLTPAEWEAASLCEAWRVRDVAAHLTLAHMSPARAVVGLVRAGGSPNGMIRDTALRQARLPVEQFAPRLRAMAGSRRHAPGVTHLEPLLDVLVHAQDIALPLGRSHPVPALPAAVAATLAWRRGWPWHARRRFDGLRLSATDVPWVAGEGEVIEGPVAGVLLVLTGRVAGLSGLGGPGLPELRRRLTG